MTHPSEVFSYILCSVCPVKLTKPALSYYVQQNEFHNRTADWVVAPPELGFLFPAFDDRAANLYNALYYTKHTEGHPERCGGRRCSALMPPCPRTSSRRPFTQCWRSPWKRSAASRWSRRSTTSCAV